MDDYETFRPIDDDVYAADRPGGTVAFRRIRAQLKSLLEFPRACSYPERVDASVPPEGGDEERDVPTIHCAAPRAVWVHSRRAGPYVTGYKAVVPVEGNVDGTQAGSIALLVRIGEETYISDWSSVTNSGSAQPKELEVTGIEISSERWVTVAIIAKTTLRSLDEARYFENRGGMLVGAETGSDPYDFTDRVFSVWRADLLDNEAATENNHYPQSPVRLDSGEHYQRVYQPHKLQFAHGYEIRPIHREADPVGYERLAANELPRYHQGPGGLRQSAEELWNRPITTNIGTIHTRKGGSNWDRPERFNRYGHDYDGIDTFTFEELTLDYCFQLRNESTRILWTGLCFGIAFGDPIAIDSRDKVWETSTVQDIDFRMKIWKRGASGTNIVDETETRPVYCFQDSSAIGGGSAQNFIFEERHASSTHLFPDEWTPAEGLTFMGRSSDERSVTEGGIVQYVPTDIEEDTGDDWFFTTVSVFADIDQSTFNGNGLSTTMPLHMEIEFGGLASGDDQKRRIVCVGSSVQQYIL